MTNEVQQTRWDRLIRRVSGSIGPGSRVGETLSELFPVLDVERVPGELLFLGGTKLGWGGAQKAADAGKKPGIQLFNPVDSGHLVTVELVNISGNFSGQIFIGLTTITLPTNTGLGFLRDVRTGTTELTVAQVRTSGDAIASANMSVRTNTNVLVAVEPRNSVAVLASGTGLLLVPSGIDTTLNVGFFWRERPAEQSELQF